VNPETIAFLALGLAAFIALVVVEYVRRTY